MKQTTTEWIKEQKENPSKYCVPCKTSARMARLLEHAELIINDVEMFETINSPYGAKEWLEDFEKFQRGEE